MKNFRLFQIQSICRRHSLAQVMIYVFDSVENIVGKGENAGYPLPDNKILDWSKLKQIADDLSKCI